MDRIANLRLRAQLAHATHRAGEALAMDGRFTSREAVLTLQSKRLAEMVGFVQASSPFYRQYYGDHGVLARKSIQIEDLPILTKDILMDNFDDIVTIVGLNRQIIDDFIAEGSDWVYDGRLLFVKSTGTSGYHTLNVFTIEELSQVSALVSRRIGLGTQRPPARRAFLFGRDPSHLSYKFSCISMPYVAEARHIPTQQSIADINRQLTEFDPDFISTFPSTLRVVVDQIKAGALNLRRDVRILSSGEILDQKLIDDCIAFVGSRPFNLYTCIEAGPIAQDCEAHALHVNEDWFIVEDAAGGALVTNLLNRSVPVLRFQFDDLLSFDVGPCDCGSHLRTLAISDAKRTGQFFVKDQFGSKKKVNTMIFKDIIYKFPPVVQSQIEQISPRDFLVRVYARPASEGLKAEVLRQINSELRAADISASEIAVDLTFVEPSAMSALNGKVKHFIPWQWNEGAQNASAS